MNHREFKRSLQAFVESRYANFDVVYPEGNPKANVMIIGLGPEQGETAPFTGDQGMLVRATLKQLGVHPKMIYLTYVVKAAAKGRPSPTHSEQWNGMVFRELGILQPKAVIILGGEVMRALFRISDNVEDMRFTRWIMPSKRTINFFVTLSPAQILNDGPDAYSAFVQDLTSVFGVRSDYFNKVAMLGK